MVEIGGHGGELCIVLSEAQGSILGGADIWG